MKPVKEQSKPLPVPITIEVKKSYQAPTKAGKKLNSRSIVTKTPPKSKPTPSKKATKYKKVDLLHLSAYQDELATYIYWKCMETMPDVTWRYSCENMIKTFNGENWSRVVDLKSYEVWANWYSDYGFCQLNAQYHGKFIKSKDFKNAHKQLDYCLWIWKDAKKRWVMPWYANEAHDYRYDYETQIRRINMRKNVVFLKE